MKSAGETAVTLNFFDKYQSTVISIKDAEKIKEKQQEIIRLSFSKGFEQLNEVEQVEITGALIQYLYKVDQGVFLNNPEDFQQEQAALFHLIHTANLTDTNKIFYEYLIGLSRFVISIQLLYEYIKYINNDLVPNDIKLYSSKLYIQDKNYSLITYFNRILILSNIGKILISHLSDSYFQGDFNPEKYWYDVEQYFHQRQYLDVAARFHKHTGSHLSQKMGSH